MLKSACVKGERGSASLEYITVLATVAVALAMGFFLFVKAFGNLYRTTAQLWALPFP